MSGITVKCIEDYGKCDIGVFRRTDLKLRHHYYGLKTCLYQIGERKWVIQLMNYQEQFDALDAYFQHYIRPAALYIKLLKDQPETYISRIEPMEEIADSMEGVYMTGAMLDAYIEEHYPRLPYAGYKSSWGNDVSKHAFCIELQMTKEITERDRERIEKELLNLGIGIYQVSIVTVTDEIVQENKKKQEEPAQFERKNHLPDYNAQFIRGMQSSAAVRRDTEFWFDSYRQIYRGDIRLEQLPFARGKDEVTRCYIKCSVWSHPNLNIRTLVLLYDQVFVDFPHRTNMEAFYAEQKLTRADIVDLVTSGRMVVVCTSDECQYDMDLIDTLYQCNPAGVITRRGVNAIYATYLRVLHNRSVAMWSMFDESLNTFMGLQGSEIGQQMSDIILWPYRALENSFECLTFCQPYKIASIGPNQLFHQKHGDKEITPEIQFELTVNAETIMFASALQATYFPFEQKSEHGIYSDSYATVILGELLNYYRYPLSYQNEQSIKVAEQLNQAKAQINLVRPEDNLSVRHVIDAAERYHTSISLRSLLEGLLELPQEEQKQRILEYNNLLAELSKQDYQNKDRISALKYLIQMTGFIPKVGPLISGMDLLQNAVKDIKSKQKKIEMERKLQSGQFGTIEDEVYLLDRLSRVAKLEWK